MISRVERRPLLGPPVAFARAPLRTGGQYFNRYTLVAAPAELARVPAHASTNVNWLSVGIFFGAHVPIALLMLKSDGVATAHALLTPVIGALWILSRRHLERAAYMAAYITGAEVLWRMTDAQVFWEFGKYATAALLMLALLRAGKTKWALLPLIYFLLLLPSAYLTLQSVDITYARKSLSFNLSGPFALMVCVLFFSNLRMSLEQLQRTFVALIGPLIGIASITALTTYTISTLKFSDQSSKLTSGGFGPNQVSAILGLGALVGMFILLDSKAGWTIKVLIFSAMTLLGVQSAMTFSRGGLYMAVGGAVLASLYLIRDTHSRLTMIVVICAIFVVTNYVVLPYLDAFTGGALSNRFMDTSSTGRDQIIMLDLHMWRENPIFGVGPGMGMLYRVRVLKWVAAHTEYSRLLAEHGVFGAASLLLLVVMAVQGVRRSKTIIGKAMSTAMIAWSFLFMSVDAMRLLAPAFVFGLSYATILSRTSLVPNLSRENLGRATRRARLRLRRRTSINNVPTPQDGKLSSETA